MTTATFRVNIHPIFLLPSLDTLVAANPPEAFQITAQHESNRERRKLLMRKDVYPYENMDTWGRFTEPKLPHQEAFYSKLPDAHISDEDCDHAQKVWATFGCKTLGDYSDLYCCTNVLLLADVFETFRKTCLRQYGLHPAHYYTSPGLSWDALLKKTGVELELLRDYNQHMLIACCVEASQWSQSAMLKPRILWSTATTQKTLAATSSTLMQTISMVRPLVNISPPVAFSGWMTASSSQKSLQSNRQTDPRALYSRWTWSTHKTYTTRTMHIRWHQSTWWLKK